MKPRMFIGSSVEQLPLAKAIQNNLQHTIKTTIWNQGVFSPSKSALDCLQEQGRRFDFGLFVFKPDDLIKLRDKTYVAVRDNVLFELGLFIGLLGKARNFCLAPGKCAPDLRVASDLIGFTPVTFDDDPRETCKESLLGPACNEIEKAVSTIWSDSYLAGEWTQEWQVSNSKNFDEKNSSRATVHHVGDHFSTCIESKKQRFEVNGTIERNSFITGTWCDILKGASYFGSFQLAISPRHDRLEGRWVGFNSKNVIQSGKWIWRKVKSR